MQPTEKQDSTAWENEVYNQKIGERISFGQSFSGDISVPLYLFELNNNQVSEAEGGAL